ncbi:hypothetical protein [Brevibacillus agri]|uniref:hypothetical protein n=1 Tax=Brevibacillus agri TaxID=51101 RepID=UPI0002A50ADA|nr:hypothetical protein [Brevibacillus agri]ELK41943.1 hypothetical protein D478_11042 [Brevibacillus agri BAB-2500]MBG9565299.1 hypothetical protein [Brevibacillus agri]
MDTLPTILRSGMDNARQAGITAEAEGKTGIADGDAPITVGIVRLSAADVVIGNLLIMRKCRQKR